MSPEFEYLDVEDLLHVAERTLGEKPQVRDLGLLGASVARPQTNFFGHEPYPTVATKAAALLVSITMNRALVDGNKRLALAATEAFVWLNIGKLIDMNSDEKYNLVVGVATGNLELEDVAAALWEAGVPDL